MLLCAVQIVQLEMEKLSIQRSADTDRHSAERLHAIDDQLIMLREEQQARAWFHLCNAKTPRRSRVRIRAQSLSGVNPLSDP